MGTVIIVEPESNSKELRSTTEDHPHAMLRLWGVLITKQSLLKPHWWLETNVLASKRSLGAGR